ncbi:hypothetical protein ACKKBG_A26555 [Auxenochlorella protothecoides x Auxenochlorella symbiontica]
MAANWVAGRSCILGDEMGLGKTAQSIAILALQQQSGGVAGPFLVVAPLTTLGHWQREIEAWTALDCVVYAGSAADREAIQVHDLWRAAGPAGGRAIRPSIVLVSFDTMLRDKALFLDVHWATVVVDEAHRMKSSGSATRAVLEALPRHWLLLLTGTPVQNNMRELHGLLSLVDPVLFGTESEFLGRYGDERTGMEAAQVQRLKVALKPILLRRMKEDVETLPEKEEVIIWVELTTTQRAYYRAMYEKQIGVLLQGAAPRNLPNLKNLAMELRKICCHPFLCNGLEDDLMRRETEAGRKLDTAARMTAASGKMLLLSKLLPKLRSEGRKVLIFSQFKIMLDVLEDYLDGEGWPHERIDGSTPSRDRQAAIDRFSAEGSDGFVFLLSTRAGGQGITLTAADTCIIYDSDWNPQNDLQAMARCHRIGQHKEVTIYRLVTRDTYEAKVFEISSRKAGLDEAILGVTGPQQDPELDSRKISELLKNGAHGLEDMAAAAQQSNEFVSEDIGQILAGRTEKRQIGSRAGNSFSVTSFAATGAGRQAGADAGEDYWQNLMPSAVAAHEAAAAAAAAPQALAPRRRRVVDYSDKARKVGRRRKQEEEDGDDSTYEAEPGSASGDDRASSGGEEDTEGVDATTTAAQARKPRKRWPKGGPRQWSPASVTAFEDALLCLGEDRAEEAMQRIGATHCADLGPEAAPALASFVRLLADTVASTPSPPRPELPSDTLQRHLNMDCPPVAALCPQEVLEAGDEAVDAWLRDFTSEKVEAATAWARSEFEARVPEFWAEHVMGRIAEQMPPRLAKVVSQPEYQSRWTLRGAAFANCLKQWKVLAAQRGRPIPFPEGAYRTIVHKKVADWFTASHFQTMLEVVQEVGFPVCGTRGLAQAMEKSVLSHPRMQAIMQKDGDSNGHQLDHVRELDHARKDSPTLFLPKPIWRHATRALTAFLVDTMGRLSQLIEEDERKRQIQSAPVLELGLAPREAAHALRVQAMDTDDQDRYSILYGKDNGNRAPVEVPRPLLSGTSDKPVPGPAMAVAPEAAPSGQKDREAGTTLPLELHRASRGPGQGSVAKRPGKQMSMSAFMCKKPKPAVVDLVEEGGEEPPTVLLH